MDQKKRLPGLIANNNNFSPLKILDVRSINEHHATSSYTLQQTEAADASDDDSSGSEKELVIDMADAELDPPDDEDYGVAVKDDVDVSMQVVVQTPPSPSPPPPAPPANNVSVKGRISRRKSQHVRLANADITFEEPTVLEVAPLEAEPKRDELQDGIEANQFIMHHIAMLRTTINYLLQQHHQTTIQFPNEASDFETMDSWMEFYEQQKSETKPGPSKEKAKK